MGGRQRNIRFDPHIDGGAGSGGREGHAGASGAAAGRPGMGQKSNSTSQLSASGNDRPSKSGLAPITMHKSSSLLGAIAMAPLSRVIHASHLFRDAPMLPPRHFEVHLTFRFIRVQAKFYFPLSLLQYSRFFIGHT